VYRPIGRVPGRTEFGSARLPILLPPRLISDFLCPSQLLPLFNPYGLTMAGFKLLRFPVLFKSISSLSRASVLCHHRHPLRYSLAWSSFDRRSLPPRFVLHRSPLSLPPRHLLFYGFMLLPILLFAYGLGIAQERDPEEGRTVTNLGRKPFGR
jgi:hypothetical protein